MKTSNLYSLDYRDFLKALLVAVLSAIYPIIEDTISKHSLTFDWSQIGTVALGAAIAYILKNFFTAASIKTPAATPTLVAEVKTADPALVITKTPGQ